MGITARKAQRTRTRTRARWVSTGTELHENRFRIVLSALVASTVTERAWVTPLIAQGARSVSRAALPLSPALLELTVTPQISDEAQTVRPALVASTVTVLDSQTRLTCVMLVSIAARKLTRPRHQMEPLVAFVRSEGTVLLAPPSPRLVILASTVLPPERERGTIV